MTVKINLILSESIVFGKASDVPLIQSKMKSKYSEFHVKGVLNKKNISCVNRNKERVITYLIYR